MLVRITEVHKGDIIIEDQGEITVRKIEHEACSSKGTHVNDRGCYDRYAKVNIKVGRAKSRHFTDTDLAEQYFEDQMFDDWSREINAWF